MYRNIYKIIVKAPTKFITPFSPGVSGAQIGTSSSLGLDQKWRKERKLPVNPNAHGPLTDGPDFSYLDGRPAPLGARQLARMQRQSELAQEVVRLSGEVDFAVERHRQILLQKEDERKKLLNSKLKPKGQLLLKKK